MVPRSLAFVVAASVLLVCGQASYAIVVGDDPTVEEISDGAGNLTFVVDNPSSSTVGDIVGLCVDLSSEPSSLGAPTGWSSQVLSSSGDWTSSMGTGLMTWQDFFAGSSYPYAGGTYVAGYYLDYTTDGTSYSFTNPGAAISPGESESGFTAALIGGPHSTFILSYVDDANGGFQTYNMGSLTDEVIPEPTVMSLVGIGGLALIRRRRSRS